MHMVVNLIRWLFSSPDHRWTTLYKFGTSLAPPCARLPSPCLLANTFIGQAHYVVGEREKGPRDRQRARSRSDRPSPRLYNKEGTRRPCRCKARGGSRKSMGEILQVDPLRLVRISVLLFRVIFPDCNFQSWARLLYLLTRWTDHQLLPRLCS